MSEALTHWHVSVMDGFIAACCSSYLGPGSEDWEEVTCGPCILEIQRECTRRGNRALLELRQWDALRDRQHARLRRLLRGQAPRVLLRAELAAVYAVRDTPEPE